MYTLNVLYPYIFYSLCGLSLVASLYRFFIYRVPTYRFPYINIIAQHGFVRSYFHTYGASVLRCATLLFLAFFAARPVWIDRTSQIMGHGRDIILAIDVSGSMQVFDDIHDRRSRLEVAKNEALKFIAKRTDDPIGIVIFARDALSRAPTTLDKHMLNQIVHGLQLGMIDQNGTSLGTGLGVAINRLRRSSSKTKIIILLTDGAPTPQTEKITPEQATELAQKFGIKIYTIGVGNSQGGLVLTPFGTVQRVTFQLDEDLLKTIAHTTGGNYYRAHNPAELSQIYQKIDALEKTEYTTKLFSHYHEAFDIFVWVLLLLMGLQYGAYFLIWRGI